MFTRSALRTAAPLRRNIRTYASQAGTKDDSPGAFVFFSLFLIGVGGVSLARSFVQIGYAVYQGMAAQVPMPTNAHETGPEYINAYELDTPIQSSGT